MERNPIAIPRQETAIRESALATNRVLRNTYLLLGATLAFSALMCGIALVFSLPHPGLAVTLIGYFALLFLVHKTANSAMGIVSVFALTGFMGYTLGPIIGYYLQAIPNGDAVVLNALGLTAIAFFGLSAYAIKSGHRFSFMGGFLFVGILTAFLLGLVAVIFSMPALSLAVSGAFVLLASGLILYQTGEIIHGGETNYILATVTLYVSIYNLFASLMHLLGAGGDD
ncbi:MAG TPA: Bax inhibitor-1/YccA family protein [Steroidobacteraceae bacterium]|nr:Bax inhibitor-1/YccA family protein [Steroidobacteraceae bacterium]